MDAYCAVGGGGWEPLTAGAERVAVHVGALEGGVSLQHLRFASGVVGAAYVPMTFRSRVDSPFAARRDQIQGRAANTVVQHVSLL